jgi:hypothetical protein
LWGIGLSRGRKLAKIDALLGNGALGDQGFKCRRARVFVELWADEDARHSDRRSEELLNRAHPFGDEELLTLSSFPPTQVASNG